jgi:hypothetical protein
MVAAVSWVVVPCSLVIVYHVTEEYATLTIRDEVQRVRKMMAYTAESGQVRMAYQSHGRGGKMELNTSQ